MSSLPILAKIGEMSQASNIALVGITTAVEYREETMVGAMVAPQLTISAAMRLRVGRPRNPKFGGIGVQIW